MGRTDRREPAAGSAAGSSGDGAQLVHLRPAPTMLTSVTTVPAETIARSIRF